MEENKNDESPKEISTTLKPITDILEDLPDEDLSIEDLSIEDLPTENMEDSSLDVETPITPIMLDSNKTTKLQYGDIIQFSSPGNLELDGQIFFIEYISTTKIKIINNDTLEKKTLSFLEGIIENGSVKQITIIDRADSPSFVIQHNFLPDTWVEIKFFDGKTINGKIIDIEEDMCSIELPTQNNQIIYIDFQYSGIPEDTNIMDINIIDEPLEEEEYIEETIDDPEIPVVTPTEFDISQIMFENVEPVRQILEMNKSYLRYSLEEQTSDFLEVLQSKVPLSKRNSYTTNKFLKMISKFIQLRKNVSIFDKNQNIIIKKDQRSFISHDHNWKPLVQPLLQFKNKLFWILLVGQNTKRSYHDFSKDIVNKDVRVINLFKDLQVLQESMDKYNNMNEMNNQNKYVTLFNSINELFSPFENNEEDSDQPSNIIYTQEVFHDVNIIIDNYKNLTSTTNSNTDMIERKFATNRYINSIDYITQTEFLTKTITNFHSLMNADMLSLKSIVTLPEPTIYFSKINLPNTNILDRSNLGLHFLQYWKLLNKKTNISNITVENLETPFEYNEDNFINDIKNYSMRIDDNSNSIENYERFLNVIIPKTRVLFNLIKQNITGKLSYYDVVKYLEPFMIYPEDITFMQYKDIHQFISGPNGMISKYITELKQKQTIMSLIPIKYKKVIRSSIFFMTFDMSNVDENDLQNVYFETVEEEKDDENANSSLPSIILNKMSNSEILKRIIENDGGCLFNNTLSLNSIGLMVPDNFSSMLDEDKNKLSETNTGIIQNQQCKTYIIAKKYKSVDSLILDNDIDPIFFDKEYDDTKYEIMEDIEQDYRKKTGKTRINSDETEFTSFVVKSVFLKYKNIKKDALDIPYISETLMNSAKKVLNGHYAIIVSVNNEQNAPDIKYYIRENLKWVFQPDITVQSTQNESLCNIQDSCMYEKQLIDGKCIPTGVVLNNSESSLLKNMSSQFENDFIVSINELKQNISTKINYSVFVAYVNKINVHSSTSNIYQYNLGLSVSQFEIKTSPYTKYLDMILKLQNFIEKQKLIIIFRNKYTREANSERLDISTGDMENIEWFYCKVSRIKLLPKFLYDLAMAFTVTNNYNEVMIQVIKKCGAISDDGDNWVDKYSGKVIKPIDFDIEEGYTKEGFKNVSRGEIEEEDGSKLILEKVVVVENKYISNESKIIHSIIKALSSNMKIDMSHHTDFIISKTREIFVKICPSENEYKLKLEQAITSGKKITETYEDINNKIMLYLSISCFLIVLQTAIPRIKLKYSFPGCVASINGFPFGSSGDLSALTYIACVTLKLKSPYNPWKTLPKTKTTIMEVLQEYLNAYLLNDIDIIQKIQSMNKFISTQPNDEIMDERHSILKWRQFLPALVPIKIKGITNVTEDFIQSIIYNLKVGSNLQQDQLKIIESKIILFSYSIQELIHKSISKELLLLQNSKQQLYLENACCNNTNIVSTLDYFIDKTKDIQIFNEIIHNFSLFLNDVNLLTKPPILSCNIAPIQKIYNISRDFNEETIYAGFIKLCNFKTDFPNSDLITAICGEKPKYINKKDTLYEIITKIKSDKRTYTMAQLLLLFKTINLQNIIHLNTHDKKHTPNEALIDLLSGLDVANDTTMITKKLQQLLSSYLETFNITDKYGLSSELPEISSIKKYLVNINKDLRGKIMLFMTKYNKQTDNHKINHFFKTMTISKPGDTFNAYNMCNFIKTCISQLGKIYPSMINLKAEFNISLPKYWGITNKHTSNIWNISDKIHHSIKKYYGDKTLSRFLEKIQFQTTNAINLSKKIPILTQSSFDEETSILLETHCLLLVMFEYIDLTDDINMISSLQNPELPETGEENKEQEILFGKEIIQSEKEIFKRKVAELLSDIFEILINSKKNIDISYDEIMDNVFKLKEAEKNRLRSELQNLSPENRLINNEFKKYKIGKWSKGENVRGYDGDRNDEEFEIMNQLNENEKIQTKNSRTNMLDNEMQEDTDRFIQEDETPDYYEADADDGDYYGEDDE